MKNCDKEKYKQIGERTNIFLNHSYCYMYFFRKFQNSKILTLIYKIILKRLEKKYMLEIGLHTKIDEKFYMGHASGITINGNSIIGKNVSVHKGVTIGQENRGKRKGTPKIGDNVWIGMNTTIVGNITIGNDVLIAANSFVNVDIPDHSVVFGNPCIIKTYSNRICTEGYL